MQPITYMTSLFTFYLKGEIKSEQNFISFKVPNTILGLIPLGAQTEKFTISQIASTATNTRLSLKYLLLGILLVLWGFSGLTESFLLGLILLLLGINNVVNAFIINLVVTTTAGQQKIISFLIFDKQKANQAAEQINAMIAGRLDDTNTRQQTNRVIDANANRPTASSMPSTATSKSIASSRPWPRAMGVFLFVGEGFIPPGSFASTST